MDIAKNNINAKSNKWQYKNEKYIYAMLALPIIGFLLFTLYPMVWAIRLSWYYYNGVPSQTVFVGWDNFVSILMDSNFWSILGNTFLFAIMKMPIELPLALFIAVLVSGKLKGGDFFRTMYFFPYIISVAIVGVVFTNLFNYFGIINGLLMKIGWISERINWFASKTTAMWVIVIASIWQTFGVNVLYFVAALRNVPKELYESARIDGANNVQVFLKITLPCITPVLRTILMLSIIGTLNSSDLILATTGGGPYGKTYTIIAYLVQSYAPGFAGANANIGYGSAMSLIVGLIFMLITLTYMKLSEKATKI